MKRFGFVVLILIIAVIGFYFGYLKGNANKLSILRSPNRSGKIQYSGQDMTVAKEVATNFFQVCSGGDFSKASTYCPYIYDIQNKLSKHSETLKGLEIISIGKPFKILFFPGVFVPYEIKFKSGITKKFYLVLRKDNTDRVWQVDGGL